MSDFSLTPAERADLYRRAERELYAINRERNLSASRNAEPSSARSSSPKPSAPPVCNTGGVSHNLPPHPGAEGPSSSPAQRTKIDTLSITARDTAKRIHELVAHVLPGAEIAGNATAPANYSAGSKITVNGQLVAWAGWGADHGRNMLYIDGAGCKLIASMPHLEQCLSTLNDLRYTRVDIASDTFKGEVGFDGIVGMYDNGLFRPGRSKVNPTRRIVDSIDSNGENLGRTIYIGAAKATKLARCYEKGLQLFGKIPSATISRALKARALKSVKAEKALANMTAELGDDWKDVMDSWYRVEIQYRHDKDRPLGHDMLSNPDHYFAGAYPACEALLPGVACMKPDYIPDDGEAAMLVQARACRDSYGPFLRTLVDRGLTAEMILEMLVADAPSKKLRAAGIDNVQDFIREVREGA